MVYNQINPQSNPEIRKEWVNPTLTELTCQKPFQASNQLDKPLKHTQGDILATSSLLNMKIRHL